MGHKNNIFINWPHYIMQHMLKCKDNNMSLPYAMLISRIFNIFSIDLSRETCVHLGWTNYFGKKTLHKLNIFHVNDIWQYGMVDDDDDDEDGEEPPQAEDHVHEPAPQGLVPHHGQMFGFQEL